MQATKALDSYIKGAVHRALDGSTLRITSASGSALVEVPVSFRQNGSGLTLSAPAIGKVSNSGRADRWSLVSGGVPMMAGRVSEDMETLNQDMVKGGDFTLHSFSISIGC